MLPTADLVVESVSIDRLDPDPANPRRISDDELDALTRSMRTWGVVQPLLARREDAPSSVATSAWSRHAGWA